MIGYIYIIKNTINDKVYIGKTTQGIDVRFKQHKSGLNNQNPKRQSYLKNAMKKYGVDNFYYEELYRCEIDDIDELNTHLSQKEIEFIKQYNAHGDGGYNLTDGGDGSSYGESNLFFGKKHTDKTKKIIGTKSKERNAIRATHTSEAISKRARNRSIRMQKGDLTPKEIAQYKRYSIERKGIHQSKEAIQKRINTMKEKRKIYPKYGTIYFTDELKMKLAKLRAPHSIQQFDKEGNLINTFNALFEIEQLFGYDRSHIAKVCRGKQKTAYGYVWKYVDDKEK